MQVKISKQPGLDRWNILTRKWWQLEWRFRTYADGPDAFLQASKIAQEYLDPREVHIVQRLTSAELTGGLADIAKTLEAEEPETTTVVEPTKIEELISELNALAEEIAFDYHVEAIEEAVKVLKTLTAKEEEMIPQIMSGYELEKLTYHSMEVETPKVWQKCTLVLRQGSWIMGAEFQPDGDFKYSLGERSGYIPASDVATWIE